MTPPRAKSVRRRPPPVHGFPGLRSIRRAPAERDDHRQKVVNREGTGPAALFDGDRQRGAVGEASLTAETPPSR